jgi:hypothetical protein
MQNNFFQQVYAAAVRMFGGDPENLTPAEGHELVTNNLEKMGDLNLKALEEKAQAIEAANTDLIAKFDDATAKVDALENEIDAIKAKLAESEQVKQDAEGKLSAIEAKLSDLASKVAASAAAPPTQKPDGDPAPIPATTNQLKTTQVPASLAGMFKI